MVKVGKLKLTFHCFVLSVSVCVRSISGRVKQYRRLFVCLFVCFLSVGVPFFLLMQCKSGSLYFLHKLLNETAYLRSKSQGVGITAFFVCPTVGNRRTSERQMGERNHSEADPVLFVTSCKVLLW